jgi:hypothetical protein
MHTVEGYHCPIEQLNGAYPLPRQRRAARLLKDMFIPRRPTFTLSDDSSTALAFAHPNLCLAFR